MSGFKELSDQVTLAQQMESDDEGTIVLINVFTIDPSDEEALIAAWKHDAEYMKEQPGYISTQLHKGVGGSPTFVNYAIWESVESFHTAFAKPEFQRRIGEYPSSAITSPHLFTKIAVPGLCVD